jgi:nitroimidazol reductase NimA-like FMN-containing flavoprotein (pyridoxamine 5'-phosphate oxidase superfamily)
MNREIRRKDRALTEDQAYAILREGADGVMATWGEDGYPYAVPLHHALVESALYVHCASAGHKLDNIGFCDKVSYCVVTDREVLSAELSTNYRSAVVFGRAVRVDGPEEKHQAFLALLRKLAPGDMENGLKAIENGLNNTTVIRIDIERISGKAKNK